MFTIKLYTVNGSPLLDKSSSLESTYPLILHSYPSACMTIKMIDWKQGIDFVYYLHFRHS